MFGENNSVHELDARMWMGFGSRVPVTFCAVHCVSWSCSGERKPGCAICDFVGTLTSLLAPGAAPSLHSWRLHTVDLGSIVKFDQKFS